MKLWDKGFNVDKAIENFTIGNDAELDLHLAPFDILGNIAHIIMLTEVGLLNKSELPALKKELANIYNSTQNGSFKIEKGMEDVHSQIESILIDKLGDVGKKIHSARSRNDQVLVDLKLFGRNELLDISHLVTKLFDALQEQSESNKNVLLPGYTHLQVAMPSSFGLWFGAHAESLADDMDLLATAFRFTNQNPLGSAAGYGSSFPINRTRTTELLGFEDLHYNVVYAQMTRGKTERTVAYAISALATTLMKFAADCCLFMSQNFGFIELPSEFTTGSSIMPHKKNPDVFELMRGKCNRLQAIPGELAAIMGNLTSGYFRDLQLLKEKYIYAFTEIKSCLEIALLMVPNIKVKQDILDDNIYDYLFSVEEVNRRVLDGIPFREAYKQVGLEIEKGVFKPNKEIYHTHEGSIGNLCTQEIKNKMLRNTAKIDASKINTAINKLLH
ncbi:MAG: argininosuccinate lyase [Flavobacteriales bacterium]|nr:argininosuccinate lyase [Flavobacteriales bacterium]